MNGQLALEFGAAQAAERAQAWTRGARGVLARFCAEGRTFTAEDLTAVVGMPPGSGNAIGSLFHFAAKEGWIQACGYQRSARPARRRSLLRVWRAAI